MTDTTFRQPEEGNAMTYIQPIPHIQPIRPTLADRIRAIIYRPTRAQLAAGRAAAQARVAELEPAVERLDRELQLVTDQRDDLQALADRWDQLIDAADEFDDELTALRRDHLALRTEHIRMIGERDSLAAEVRRVEELYVEMAHQREAGYAEAAMWKAKYLDAFGDLAPDVPTAEPLGGQVVDLLAYREAAAAEPVGEYHSGLTGGWRTDDLRAIAAEAHGASA